MELWRRTIPGIQFLLEENGQRNNVESIEIGLPRARLRSVCSRCSSVVCRRAARMPRPGWTRIFPERRISKSSDHSYIRLHTLFPTFPLPAFRPRDSPRSAGSIPRVDSIFLFFTVSTMSFLVLFLPLPLSHFPRATRATRRRVQCDEPPRKGARNYLRFIANIGFCGFFLRAKFASATALVSFLYSLFTPFVLPSVKKKKIIAFNQGEKDQKRGETFSELGVSSLLSLVV